MVLNTTSYLEVSFISTLTAIIPTPVFYPTNASTAFVFGHVCQSEVIVNVRHGVDLFSPFGHFPSDLKQYV
jgi:hypothetical protein